MSTPTTVARAAPDSGPKSAIAVATASSLRRLLESTTGLEDLPRRKRSSEILRADERHCLHRRHQLIHARLFRFIAPQGFGTRKIG